MNDIAVALNQPEDAPDCPGCQGALIVEAFFCHQCGVRVRPDPYPLPRLMAALFFAVVGLGMGMAGLVWMMDTWFFGLLMLAGAFLTLREARNWLR